MRADFTIRCVLPVLPHDTVALTASLAGARYVSEMGSSLYQCQEAHTERR